MEDRVYDKGPITVSFKFPSINLKLIDTVSVPIWYNRAAESTRKREFTLRDDWEISFERVDYIDGINGTIVIPKAVNNQPVEFDGASVPLPWLVSFLSIGILRPMGVMLTASIVHDFLFKFGYLLVRQDDGALKKVEIERHNADRLFRDIIATVNRLYFTHWIGWLSVRIGWLFIKYADKPKYNDGEKPVAVLTGTALLIASIGAYIFNDFWETLDKSVWIFMERIGDLLAPLVALYFVLYIASIIVLRFKGKEKKYSDNTALTKT